MLKVKRENTYKDINSVTHKPMKIRIINMIKSPLGSAETMIEVSILTAVENVGFVDDIYDPDFE